MRLVAAVLAAVWALAGWRNLPPLTDGQGVAAGFIVATSCALCYFAGTRRQRDQNMAVAMASAEATAVAAVTGSGNSSSAVNVFVASPETMVAARSARGGVALDNAPWMVGAGRRLEVEEGDDALAVALADVESDREVEAL